MWPWQLKSIQKRHQLWLKLFCIILFFHALFLWLMFFYHYTSRDISFILNKKVDYQSPILFVPVYNESLFAKKTVEDSSRDSLLKEEQSKIVPLTSLVSGENKQVVVEQQSAQVKKNISDKSIVKKIVKQIDKPQPVKVHNKSFKVPDKALVSHDYREVEDMRRMVLLQKEISTYWSPPVGVAADVTCDIRVEVDDKGLVNKIAVTKTSGVMMYDISARNSLLKMKMPKWMWGRSMTITFNQ